MEYAVELNRLISYEMEGQLGKICFRFTKIKDFEDDLYKKNRGLKIAIFIIFVDKSDKLIPPNL